MRILYVCADFGIPVLGRKGAAVHVRELVAAFTRRGHSVAVAAPVATKSVWDEPAALSAPLLEIPPAPESTAAVATVKAFTRALGTSPSLSAELRRILYDRQLVAELKRRFEADPPDVLYERASLYSTAGAELARSFGVPLLVELNAPLALEQAAYRGNELRELAVAAERSTLCRADAVLAVSAPLRDYAVSLGAAGERVHVVPNGVDTDVFHPEAPDAGLRAELGLNGGPVLGFVGGLRPWHGLEFLPPLLERVVARHPDLRLLVVGDGPLRVELERDLRARGVAGNALLTGALPHEAVPPLIRQFDAALAPYPQANGHPFYFSPLKLFEYMACGVPVVGARIGQLSDVIADGENGLLYPAGDLDGLVAACERLLADRALRRRLGGAAAEAIRTNYTWDGNAARVEHLASALVAAGEVAA